MRKVNVLKLPPEIKVHYDYFNKVEAKRTKYAEKAYYNLKETQTINGFRQELELQSYNITPDSVKSFVDSVNYKADLNGNLSNRGTNLGDISNVQELVSKDSATLKELSKNISTLTKAFNELKEKQDNKEVKPNE